MADRDESNPADALHLPVISSNAKLDEFRRDLAASGALAKKLADRNVIDRALDPTTSPQQKRIQEKVIEILRTVYDPELPVNIYELGLIYAIDVAPDNSVHVQMTLTAPACPVAGTLPPEVERRIETIDEVPRAKVEVVWDPPWTRDRMSEAALLELGLV